VYGTDTMLLLFAIFNCLHLTHASECNITLQQSLVVLQACGVVNESFEA